MDLFPTEAKSVGFFRDFEDLADEWMIQGRRSKSFAAQALAGNGVPSQMGR